MALERTSFRNRARKFLREIKKVSKGKAYLIATTTRNLENEGFSRKVLENLWNKAILTESFLQFNESLWNPNDKDNYRTSKIKIEIDS